RVTAARWSGRLRAPAAFVMHGHLGSDRSTCRTILRPHMRRTAMRRLTLLLTAGIAAFAPIVLAQATGPYKVLKTARVGGEGGTDYIYADTVGRRLYITPGATHAR